MTTLNQPTSAVVDGEFVEQPTGPTQPPPQPPPDPARRYVRNPHLESVLGCIVAVLIAAGGVVYSVYRDDPHAHLAFAVLLFMVGVLAVLVRLFNAWDDDALTAEPVDSGDLL